MRFLFCVWLAFAASHASRAAASATTNQPPRAARSVQLVYDASESDRYFMEMTVEKSANNSLFGACAWYNGYIGLQQFDGDNKRTVIFAVWDDAYNDERNAPKIERPVELVYQNPRVKVSPYEREGKGLHAIRQFNWRIGEAQRFCIEAARQTNQTAYTAWIFDKPSGQWEKLATFQCAPRTKWLRGYYSFIEDFHRNTESIAQTRRARFGSVWNHEFRGSWIHIKQATFTVARHPLEARDRFNAGQENGEFFLATGGDTVKTGRIGAQIRLQFPPPLQEPPPPDLPFFYSREK